MAVTGVIGGIAAPGLGDSTGNASGKGGTDGFAALLGGLGGRGAAATPAPSNATSTAADTARDASTPREGRTPQSGLSQAGASGAELVETKVQIARGLRTFEAETLQAMRRAQAEGGEGAAQDVLTGAAQALGAMLGGTDAVLGTDAASLVRTLAKRLGQAAEAAGPTAKDGALTGDTGADGTGADGAGDPLATAQQMFALVAQALGLVSASAQPVRAPAVPSAGGEVAGAITAAAGTGEAGELLAPGEGASAMDPRLRALTSALAQSAEEAGAVDPRQLPHGMGPQKGPQEAGAGLVAQLAGVPGNDPFAQMLSAGNVQAAQVPSDAVPSGGTQAVQGAQASAAGAATTAPVAGFAGMLGMQVRAAQPSEGVTRIALSPKGLGEIEIDMKRDASGKLSVVVRAENPMVLTALRNDQARLGEILGSSSGGGAAPDLDFQSFGRGSGGGAGQDRRGGGPAALEASDDTGEAPAWQDRIGRGALDIRT